MSTFNGIVTEFPDIRIDYFRLGPDASEVRACFLTHIHSDHLAGLESVRSLFVYCSAATKELLLRLERYQDRINFGQGILESRRITYGKHFKGVLRPIPLNVPTEIELSHRRKIRVTLLPANHCPGAVMFLIESTSSAVLYTGDIRAEPWWVNMIARNPAFIPYSNGIRTLDKIYLDTTNAYTSNLQKTYGAKVDGVKELIQSISKYPADTIFHINSWTLGYEDVFLAVSTVLRSKIHIDDYKMRLYTSLAKCTDSVPPEESTALCGFNFGNGRQEGCLTTDPNTRLHTCELGMECSGLDPCRTVYVTPVVTRTDDGLEIQELGAATGTGDLDLAHEIDLSSPEMVQNLLQLCMDQLEDADIRDKLVRLILKAAKSGKRTLSIPSADLPEDLTDISLPQVLELMVKAVEVDDSASQLAQSQDSTISGHELPRRITFPYSRHSSYTELCHFLSILKPRDIYPCVIDETAWTPEKSIKALFGEYCTSDSFAHDVEMVEKHRQLRPSKRSRFRGQRTRLIPTPNPDANTPERLSDLPFPLPTHASAVRNSSPQPEEVAEATERSKHRPSSSPMERPLSSLSRSLSTSPTPSIPDSDLEDEPRDNSEDGLSSIAASKQPGKKRKRTASEERRLGMRRAAFRAARCEDGTAWRRVHLMGFRGYEIEEEL